VQSAAIHSPTVPRTLTLGGNEYPVHVPCDKRHVFGYVCILQWFMENKTSCPLCRCEFDIDRETGHPSEPKEVRDRRIAAREASVTPVRDDGWHIINQSDLMPGELEDEAEPIAVGEDQADAEHDNRELGLQELAEGRRYIHQEADELIRQESGYRE
jgi:hypothetical protein